MDDNLTQRRRVGKVRRPDKACLKALAAEGRRRERLPDHRKRAKAWRAKVPNRPKARPADKPVFFSVPAEYDHSKMPPKFRLRVDDAHYILSLLVEGQQSKHHDHGSYVPLQATLLRKYIAPRHEASVKRMLVREKVIECDGVFRVGKKAMGYRLTEAYTGKLRRIECGSATMANKILEWRRARDAEIDEHEPDGHLFKWLRRLKIDLPRAVHAIRESHVVDDPHLSLNACETIANAEWEYKICKQRRRHTNVTRLDTVARDHLSIDGVPLVNAADIRNSQVVFFAIMLKEARGDALSEDERRFIKRTMKGKIYDDLMALAGWGHDRRRFKSDFFTYVFYADPVKRWNAGHPLTELFARRFPNVYRFILERKRGGHERLPCDMQRAEAEFMIERVCLRLARQHPHVPLITIHDSILTYQRHEELVRRVIMEEFRKKYGIRPAISPPTVTT